MGKWLGIRRLIEDNFLGFFEPQQNQNSIAKRRKSLILK